jgi:hypothetical protein
VFSILSPAPGNKRSSKETTCFTSLLIHFLLRLGLAPPLPISPDITAYAIALPVVIRELVIYFQEAELPPRY